MSGLQGTAAEAAWIRSRMIDGWTVSGALRTPISWPNAPFSKPASGGWIRLLIRRSGGDPASIGAPASQQHRYSGMLVIEVHTPAGTSTAANDAYCDVIEALFRQISDSGIRFWTPHTATVGDVDGWFKQDVLCPYERDTIYVAGFDDGFDEGFA